MKITVTQEDIEKGSPGDAFECPVACALNRAVPLGDGSWRVSPISFNGPEWRAQPTTSDGWAKIPEEAVEFIEQYDCGEDVEPFEFELEIEEAA